MTSNQFFLRDSYTAEEMLDRIPAAKINSGVEGFERVVTDYGLEPSELGNLNKSDFIPRISAELEDYDSFVADLFDVIGQTGDKFNLQIFDLPPNRDYSQIPEIVESLVGSRFDTRFDFVDNGLLFRDFEVREELGPSNQSAIDMMFQSSEEVEDIQPDEDLPITVRRADTDEVVKEYGVEYYVEAPSRQFIEARTYFNSKYCVVSNGSGIKQGTQNDVVSSIIEIGEPIERENAEEETP